jgi:hypothetical protein
MGVEPQRRRQPVWSGRRDCPAFETLQLPWRVWRPLWCVAFHLPTLLLAHHLASRSVSRDGRCSARGNASAISAAEMGKAHAISAWRDIRMMSCAVSGIYAFL